MQRCWLTWACRTMTCGIPRRRRSTTRVRLGHAAEAQTAMSRDPRARAKSQRTPSCCCNDCARRVSLGAVQTFYWFVPSKESSCLGCVCTTERIKSILPCLQLCINTRSYRPDHSRFQILDHCDDVLQYDAIHFRTLLATLLREGRRIKILAVSCTPIQGVLRGRQQWHRGLCTLLWTLMA